MPDDVVGLSAQRWARVLWDYLRIGAPLERCQAIVAFGGHDLRVADWAAQLWLEGWASRLVLSGGLGYYTSKIWYQPEAHKFRQIALARGVDAGAILIEDRSRNSGENVAFTRALLQEHGLSLHRAICVQKPYLELRVLLTLRKQWPGCEFQMSSPPIPFEHYPRKDIIEVGKLINELVGQVDRVERYPALGFTESVQVPEEVLRAKRHLVELGFVSHLITSPHPLRLLATNPAERFQLRFAEQAALVLTGFSGIQALGTAHGVVISGATERDLQAATALLEAAISSVKIGAIEVVYQNEGTMEPYLRVRVTTPVDHYGDLINDLNTRRGEIEGFDDLGDGKRLVSARVPVSNMMGFDQALAKMTRNRATVEYDFAGYEPRREM